MLRECRALFSTVWTIFLLSFFNSNERDCIIWNVEGMHSSSSMLFLVFCFCLFLNSLFRLSFFLRSFACLSFMSKLFPLIRHRNSVSKWKNSKRKAWNLTRPAASLVESVCFRYGEESSVNLIIQWPFLCFATRSNPSASSLNVIHHYRQPISAIAYYEVHHLFSYFFSFDVDALSVSSRTFFWVYTWKSCS